MKLKAKVSQIAEKSDAAQNLAVTKKQPEYDSTNEIQQAVLNQCQSQVDKFNQD
jgi:hypothetical protein